MSHEQKRKSGSLLTDLGKRFQKTLDNFNNLSRPLEVEVGEQTFCREDGRGRGRSLHSEINNLKNTLNFNTYRSFSLEEKLELAKALENKFEALESIFDEYELKMRANKQEIILMERERTGVKNELATAEAKIRELTRDKISNETEIRALRDELSEVHAKSREKSSECDLLFRELEVLKTSTSSQANIETSRELELIGRLKAAESKAALLEAENVALMDKNERQFSQIEDITNSQFAKVQKLYSTIKKLKMQHSLEQEGFVSDIKRLNNLVLQFEKKISEMQSELEASKKEQENIINEQNAVSEETWNCCTEFCTDMQRVANAIIIMDEENSKNRASLESMRTKIAEAASEAEKFETATLARCEQMLSTLSFNCQETENDNNHAEDSSVADQSPDNSQLIIKRIKRVKRIIQNICDAGTQSKTKYLSKEQNYLKRINDLDAQLTRLTLFHAEEMDKMNKENFKLKNPSIPDPIVSESPTDVTNALKKLELLQMKIKKFEKDLFHDPSELSGERSEKTEHGGLDMGDNQTSSSSFLAD